MNWPRVLGENEWPTSPGAMGRARAEALQRDWRQYRRAWLILLARCSTLPTEALPTLSKDERNFIDYTRARGVS